MRNRFAVFAGTLVLSAAAMAAETYRCPLIVTDPGAEPRVDTAQYVDLSIDDASVTPTIHITDASKDLTFTFCTTLKPDGSNFSEWFSIECKTMAGADGGSYTVDVYLADAYAGISPPIDESYPLYQPIADIGEKLGLETPPRTFAIYANRQPQYEFFCYPTD